MPFPGSAHKFDLIPPRSFGPIVFLFRFPPKRQADPLFILTELRDVLVGEPTYTHTRCLSLCGPVYIPGWLVFTL